MAIRACPEAQLKPQSNASHCLLCGREFGVFRWKYNCHMCGEVVCDDCTKTEVALPPVYRDPVRVCDSCKSAAPQPRAPGGGRRLGGDGPRVQGTEEEERAFRARLAEERMIKAQNRGRQPASTQRFVPAPPPSSGTAPQAESSPVFTDQKRQQPSDNPMLEAALRRQASQQGASGGGVNDSKADLIARINAIHTNRGEDEPFGLRSMEVPKLRMYLRHLEEQRK